jgi:hypothetical protein
VVLKSRRWIRTHTTRTSGYWRQKRHGMRSRCGVAIDVHCRQTQILRVIFSVRQATLGRLTNSMGCERLKIASKMLTQGTSRNVCSGRGKLVPLDLSRTAGISSQNYSGIHDAGHVAFKTLRADRIFGVLPAVLEATIPGFQNILHGLNPKILNGLMFGPQESRMYSDRTIVACLGAFRNRQIWSARSVLMAAWPASWMHK